MPDIKQSIHDRQTAMELAIKASQVFLPRIPIGGANVFL